jgi:hypothetical protein
VEVKSASNELTIAVPEKVEWAARAGRRIAPALSIFISIPRDLHLRGPFGG